MNRLCSLLLIVFLLTSGCELFPESVFMLSSESRLPHWFKLPAGATRSDVSVRMAYYANHVTFILSDERSRVQLNSVRGQVLNDYPLKLDRFDPRVPPGTRASYSVVKVGDIVEIVEHFRSDPIFDISDDPALRAELLEMVRRNWGIKGLR